MARLLRWVAEPDVTEPPIVAAVAHAWLAAIHPFADGNGRTARLIANLILMRAKYPIIVLRSERRPEYISALHQADEGDLSSLLKLTLTSIEESLNEYERARNDQRKAAESSLNLAERLSKTAAPDEPGFVVLQEAVETLSSSLHQIAENTTNLLTVMPDGKLGPFSDTDFGQRGLLVKGDFSFNFEDFEKARAGVTQKYLASLESKTPRRTVVANAYLGASRRLRDRSDKPLVVIFFSFLAADQVVHHQEVAPEGHLFVLIDYRNNELATELREKTANEVASAIWGDLIGPADQT
jgi:hypothetical protein